MNPKIEKLEKEIEKTKTKIAEMQAKLHKLEEQKTELENTDFVAVARSYHLTPQELAEFLKTRQMASAQEQFGPCPFKNAKTPENVFFADANAYTTAGNYIVTWDFNWTPAVNDWRAGVVDALTQYTVNGGSWDNVKTAFVDGWATQYAKENG